MIKRVLNRLNIVSCVTGAAKFVFGDSFSAFAEAAHNQATKKVEDIVFDTSSTLALWRAQTHLSKEPGTIDWIKDFGPDDVLFDIGANIGVYTLYAAKCRGIKVYAFEPSPFNYATLCRNLVLNQLSDRVSAFCLALSNKTVIDDLHISSLQVGAAHTGFQNPVNEFGGALNAVHKQATLGFRLDDFIKMFDIPVPQHIKIDVDGAESLVVSGMENTLLDPELKSILIELPARKGDELPEVLSAVLRAGFVIKKEEHPDGDTRLCNYILVRKV